MFWSHTVPGNRKCAFILQPKLNFWVMFNQNVVILLHLARLISPELLNTSADIISLHLGLIHLSWWLRQKAYWFLKPCFLLRELGDLIYLRMVVRVTVLAGWNISLTFGVKHFWYIVKLLILQIWQIWHQIRVIPNAPLFCQGMFFLFYLPFRSFWGLLRLCKSRYIVDLAGLESALCILQLRRICLDACSLHLA